MLAEAAEQVASKSEFARLCGVVPGAVTNWINEGKITPDALVGEGRSAKIRVDAARRQLRLRRDLSQSLGNGLHTRLDGPAPPRTGRTLPGLDQPTRITEGSTAADVIDDQIRQAKLWELQARNRETAEKEAARRGRYTETATVRREMAQVAAQMMRAFEGGLPEIASALAAEFRLEHRDVMHVLRGAFRRVREKAAGQARQAARGLPELIEAKDA